MVNIGKEPTHISGFHRGLIFRLIMAGIILVVLLGFLTWAKERKNVGEAIIVRALTGASAFNIFTQHLIDDPGWPDKRAVQEALEQFSTRRVNDPNGQFIYARIYDERSAVIAQRTMASPPDNETANRLIYSAPLKFPDDDENMAEVFWIEGKPFISIVLPLFHTRGDPIAHIHGIYAVSQKALTGIRRQALQSVMWVIAVIAITTLILFPTIMMQTRRLKKLTQNLLDSNLETLKALGSAIAKRDSDTDAHNYRVTIYAVRLAEALNLDKPTIMSLIKGAFLHDVGKIGVRDNILLKPGRLDDEEFEVMKTHVPHGVEIVARSSWLRDANDIVGYHHEKFDGSGYFKGLSKNNIPTAARIFAIADVFDALISRRPYKEPLSLEEAMGIILEGRGTHFDPDILDAFINIAPSLYDHFAGREDDSLKRELETITEKYFSKEI